MGYQEYVYKVEKPVKFIKNKKIIDRFIDKDLIDQVDYSFVQFKEKLVNIEPGFYVYVCGDRQFGSRLLGKLDIVLGKSKYAECIEEAINSYKNDSEIPGNRLRRLFRDKSTDLGRVLKEYEEVKGCEKNQREFQR